MPSVRGFERVYAVCAVFLLSGVLLPYLLEANLPNPIVLQKLKQIDFERGNYGRQISFAILYSTSAVLLVRRASADLVRVAMPLVILAAWSCATALWSHSPGSALRHGIGVLGVVLIASYMALRFHPARMVTHLRLVIAANVVSAIVMAAFAPEEAFQSGLKGALSHKNYFGLLCAVSVIALVWRLVDGPPVRTVQRALDILMLLASVALLVLSNSVTSMIGLAVALAVYCCARIGFGSRGTSAALLPAVIGVTLAALTIGWPYVSDLASLLDRDTTLTGRTPIWEFAIDMIGKNPMGYGYTTFWLGPDAPGSQFFVAKWQFVVFHAHNFVLQMALDTGLVGVAFFGAVLAHALVQLVWLLRRRSAPEDLWHTTCLTLLLTTSSTEAVMWNPNDFNTWLTCYTIIRIGLNWRAERARCAAPARTTLLPRAGLAPVPQGQAVLSERGRPCSYATR